MPDLKPGIINSKIFTYMLVNDCVRNIPYDTGCCHKWHKGTLLLV